MRRSREGGVPLRSGRFRSFRAQDSRTRRSFRVQDSRTVGGDGDQAELETAMWGILSVANTWDDELQQRFGGKRANE